MAKENRTPSVNGQRVRPVHSVRLGRISAAIWANATKSGQTMHNVSVTRLYKDDEGAWQRSQSYGLQDLPLVARVCDMALTWIYQQTQEDAQQTQGDTDSDVPF